MIGYFAFTQIEELKFDLLPPNEKRFSGTENLFKRGCQYAD